MGEVSVFLEDFGLDLTEIDDMRAYEYAAKRAKLFGWVFVPF
jgi:hypothetical protein